MGVRTRQVISGAIQQPGTWDPATAGVIVHVLSDDRVLDETPAQPSAFRIGLTSRITPAARRQSTPEITKARR